MANFNNNDNKDIKKGVSKEEKEALDKANAFKSSFFNYDFSNIKRHTPLDNQQNAEKVYHNANKTIDEQTVIIDDDKAEKPKMKNDGSEGKKNEDSKKISNSKNIEQELKGKYSDSGNADSKEGGKNDKEKESEVEEKEKHKKEKTDEADIVELDTADEEETEENEYVSKDEFEKLKDSYLRLKADFENYKKNNNEVATKMYNEGKADTLIKIFPVLDSFDLGLASGSDTDKKGITAIYKQLLEILAKMNVEAIDEIDVDFDPKIHDAVMSVEDPEKSGKVVEILKKGYKLNDKILRYAMVKVAQ